MLRPQLRVKREVCDDRQDLSVDDEIDAAARVNRAPATFESGAHLFPAPGVASGARITGIDAARGFAMVLVCFSHIRHHFVESAPGLYAALTLSTRLATPTFLLLSGFVIGYLLRRADGNIAIRLVDRGLFLLLVAHSLLGLVDLRSVSFLEWWFGRVTITDAIGVALFVAVVAYRLSSTTLLTMGFLLALISWPIALVFESDSPAIEHFGAVLFNPTSQASPLMDAALVPYLGVFLIGMGLSKRHDSVMRP
jgi:uncharacterized membrane protein